MRPLTERQIDILAILRDSPEPLSSGVIAYRLGGRKAGRGRPSTGARNTLGALERRNLVRESFPYGHRSTGLWRIAPAGKLLVDRERPAR